MRFPLLALLVTTTLPACPESTSSPDDTAGGSDTQTLNDTTLDAAVDGVIPPDTEDAATDSTPDIPPDDIESDDATTGVDTKADTAQLDVNNPPDWTGRPTGTATLLEGACPRGNGPLAGGRCEYVRIECPELEARRVELRIAPPTGGTPRGLVVFQSGSVGGAPFTNAGTPTIDMFTRLRAEGFTVVERMWSQEDGQGGWFPGTAGLAASACRMATVYHYLAEKVGEDEALCAVGNSGGSAELGLTLARYDAADVLDHATLSSGPLGGLADACGVPSTAWDAECAELLAASAPHCADRPVCSLEGPKEAIDLAYGDSKPCTGAVGETIDGDGLSDTPDGRLALPIEVDFVYGTEDCGGTTATGLSWARDVAAAGTVTRITLVEGAEHQVHGSEVGARALEAIVLARCVKGDAPVQPSPGATCTRDEDCDSGEVCAASGPSAGTCVHIAECPADDAFDDALCPDVTPRWVVNGRNRIAKLHRLLCTRRDVRADFHPVDAPGTVTGSVEDVFCKQTVVDELLPPGVYNIRWYDHTGAEIVLQAGVLEDLEIPGP